MPELLDVPVSELRPFDHLAEGQSIRCVTFFSGGRVVAEVGVVQGQEVDDPPGLVLPRWTDMQEIDYEGDEIVRIARSVPIPIRRL